MNPRIELHVEPLAQILPAEGSQEGVWRAHGGDPSFNCKWGHEGPIPGGWYEIELDVEVGRGSLHLPCFYPDYGRGYILESEKITLPLKHAKNGVHQVRTLVRFVLDVTKLRFDPSVLPSEFRLRRFNIRRVGRLTAARDMFSGLLARKSGAGKLGVVSRMLADLVRGGPSTMADRMYHEFAEKGADTTVSDYALWVDFYDDATEDAVLLARGALDDILHKPLFSIVMPVYNTAERWLRGCIESVLAQAYPHWELCIADDASTAAPRTASAAGIRLARSPDQAGVPRKKRPHRQRIQQCFGSGNR